MHYTVMQKCRPCNQGLSRIPGHAGFVRVSESAESAISLIRMPIGPRLFFLKFRI